VSLGLLYATLTLVPRSFIVPSKREIQPEDRASLRGDVFHFNLCSVEVASLPPFFPNLPLLSLISSVLIFSVCMSLFGQAPLSARLSPPFLFVSRLTNGILAQFRFCPPTGFPCFKSLTLPEWFPPSPPGRVVRAASCLCDSTGSRILMDQVRFSSSEPAVASFPRNYTAFFCDYCAAS